MTRIREEEEESFLCASILCRCQSMFSTWPFVHYQTCEHDIVKTNEPVLLQIGTSGPWDSGMKQSTSGVGGQWSRYLARHRS